MGLLKPKLDPAIKAKKERPGVRAFVSVDCIAGLSVPAKAFCQIYYLDDRIEVDTPDTEYSISMERVQDVSLQREFYEKSKVTSSMGGAFVGALIAGPTGAIIGGRPKEKRTVHSASFLVIEYTGADGASAQMVFDATYTPKCKDMATLFRQQHPIAAQAKKQVTL